MRNEPTVKFNFEAYTFGGAQIGYCYHITEETTYTVLGDWTINGNSINRNTDKMIFSSMTDAMAWIGNDKTIREAHAIKEFNGLHSVTISGLSQLPAHK